MSHIFLLIAIFFVSQVCLSQNLISNGSFEKYNHCIDEYGEIETAIGWFQQEGSSDYYNKCCKKRNFVGVPQNFNGYQKPFDGDAYAGMYLFYSDKRYTLNGYYNREYIQTKLLKPLETNRKYKVSFYYSLADSSEFYTDHFSICFSKAEKLQKVKLIEDVLVCENKVSQNVLKDEARDFVEWHKVEFEYLAKGGEAFLTLGFFFEDLSKKEYKRMVKKNRVKPKLHSYENTCYYYVDSVSVIDENKIFTHYPN